MAKLPSSRDLDEALITAPLPIHPPAMDPGKALGGIVVDDHGSYHDIVGLTLRTFSEVLPAALEDELLSDLAASSGRQQKTLRRWIAQEFFDDHLKRYSSSRREAPIYWQLATSSASYSVWLYVHAFTKDTLYKVQNDYVAPKLVHEERKLEALRRELGKSLRTHRAVVEPFVCGDAPSECVIIYLPGCERDRQGFAGVDGTRKGRGVL